MNANLQKSIDAENQNKTITWAVLPLVSLTFGATIIAANSKSPVLLFCAALFVIHLLLCAISLLVHGHSPRLTRSDVPEVKNLGIMLDGIGSLLDYIGSACCIAALTNLAFNLCWRSI